VTLKEASNVSYKIYSVTGQMVAESAGTMMDAGQHGITVDASAWNAGLYIYKVQIGKDSFTGKLTVR
jgi:hypothetical protein